MPEDDLLAIELCNHIDILQETVSECGVSIYKIVDFIITCFQHGYKLLLCGNGGSAADTQHIAAEFINRYCLDRPALPAIALTTDSSILTCIGNDSCFDNIYSRQVEAIANKGDLLVALSTSGRSTNILKALEAARLKGVTTIGFTGENGRESMGPLCDSCIVVLSTDTARIQECHEFIWHFICGVIEEKLFKEDKNGDI
jgi:D-sedoheptulose 7-phosphate isomerase